jgi:hypothetical protein
MKGVISIHKSKKDRQHNGQKKDRQHNGQKKDRFYYTCRDTSFPYKNVLIYINNIHYFETLQQKLYLIINKLILVICHYTRVLIGLKSWGYLSMNEI